MWRRFRRVSRGDGVQQSDLRLPVSPDHPCALFQLAEVAAQYCFGVRQHRVLHLGRTGRDRPGLDSIAANFHLGQAIASAGAARRDRLIRWSVAGNLLILIIFKYLDFVVDNANAVLDAYWHWKMPSAHIPLPIGISFFTFHIISYLVDVYRGVAPP